MKVRAIHRGHVKAFPARKRADGLSKNSVRLIRATLSVLLTDAVDDGLVPTNPAVGLGRRGRKAPDTITATERQRAIRPLSYEQLATILEVARTRLSRRDWTLFLALADTGLRPGEALALLWDDFDAADRTLKVERALSGGQVKPTKTEETRSVDVSARLAEALGQLQTEMEAEALLQGRDPAPWIFFSGAGTRATLTGSPPRARLWRLRHHIAPQPPLHSIRVMKG